MCSLCLSRDDSGEATLEGVEEEFGGLEEVRAFVNAVRAQSEAIMIAAVQQGAHTAHPAWSRLSNTPLKQSQEWGPTSTLLGITGGFATPPQVIIEAWSTPPQVITF